MTELPVSIHAEARVGEVKVSRPFISLRRDVDRQISVNVRAGEKEREVKGPWSMAVAVRRWGEAASVVYASGTVGTEKFPEQEAILLGSQAMVEAMIDSRGGWEGGFNAVRGELGRISFPRAVFENIHEDQLLLARQNLERWWLSRRRGGSSLKENTAGRRCADMIMGVKSESGRALAYELVRLGLTTIARRRRTYGGEASIPLPSEALGPLRFFGIELLSEDPVVGDEPRKAMVIRGASDMRATSVPGASESTEARRKRLTETESAFRGKIAALKAIVEERKKKKSLGIDILGQASRTGGSPSAVDQEGGREQRPVVAGAALDQARVPQETASKGVEPVGQRDWLSEIVKSVGSDQVVTGEKVVEGEGIKKETKTRKKRRRQGPSEVGVTQQREGSDLDGGQLTVEQVEGTAERKFAEAQGLVAALRAIEDVTKAQLATEGKLVGKIMAAHREAIADQNETLRAAMGAPNK